MSGPRVSLSGLAAHAVQREALYHQARLLLLINAFSSPDRPLAGLTKLAKLDFLLRYPVMAQRLLPEDTSWPQGLEPTWDEQHAVESKMIRYKYGPWDDRYYPLLGALVGRQLAVFAGQDRAFAIYCTARGQHAAQALANDPEWRIVDQRTHFLRLHFDLGGQVLKDLIYAKLPDVVALPMRSEI